MKTAPVDLHDLQRNSGIRVPVTIQGTGFSLPQTVVTNEELCKNLDSTDSWIQEKTGIKERRFLSEEYVTSDLAIQAAEEALEQAGVSSQDIDAIILTTTTPDQRLPSTAMVIKEALGAANAMPIDLNQAACAGGILSTVIGTHLLQNELYNNVLVIGAEVLSRATNPRDRTTRVFFGDAAGAFVLQKTDEGYGLLAWDIDSTLNNAVNIVGGGSTPLPEHISHENSQYIQMDGKEVWKVATKEIPLSMKRVIQKAGLESQDIDHFLIHQANYNIVKAALDDLNVSLDKTTFTVKDYANTGAASLFSVLYKAFRENRIHDGDYVVLSGIGAGFLWGSLCFKYKNN